MQIPYELLLGWRYTRAGRATRRNGFISFISGVSMLGIALGVAALIIVLSVMNGFQKEVRDRMLSVVSHIEIFGPGGGVLPDLSTDHVARPGATPRWSARRLSSPRSRCWRAARTCAARSCAASTPSWSRRSPTW
jgi:ABC-type lipoprotein release transport system permease subunit